MTPLCSEPINLGQPKTTRSSIVIGDSARRDLGGAIAAGMDCILVGGAIQPSAFATVANLLNIVASIALAQFHGP